MPTQVFATCVLPNMDRKADAFIFTRCFIVAQRYQPDPSGDVGNQVKHMENSLIKALRDTSLSTLPKTTNSLEYPVVRVMECYLKEL